MVGTKSGAKIPCGRSSVDWASVELASDAMLSAPMVACKMVPGLGLDSALDPVAPPAMDRSEVKNAMRDQSNNEAKPTRIRITNELSPA